MIDIYNHRKKPGMDCGEWQTYAGAPVESAAISLIKYELGYGGTLISERCTKTQLVVRTNIMNCVDTVRFVGSEEDILVLYRLAAPCTQAHSLTMGNRASFDKIVDEVMRVTEGKAFLVANATPLLLGGRFTRVGMLSIIYGDGEETEEAVRSFEKRFEVFDLEKLIAMATARLTNPEFTLDEIVEIIN